MGNKKRNRKGGNDQKEEIETPTTESFPTLEESNSGDTNAKNEQRSTKSAEREKVKKPGDIELKIKKKGQKKAPSVEKEVEEEPKYSKRKIVSNWERYEERQQEQAEEEEMKGADYKQLLDFGGSGSHFQFQSEALWESEGLGTYDLSVDTAPLVRALNCIPLHERFKLLPGTLPNDIIQELTREAFEVSKPYYESAGKTPPQFQEEIPAIEDEIVATSQEVVPEPEVIEVATEKTETPTMDSAEQTKVATEQLQVATEQPQVAAEQTKVATEQPQVAAEQPQTARQKRERRPRRTQAKETAESQVPQENVTSQPQKAIEDENPKLQNSLHASSNIVEDDAKKITPEKLEESNSARVDSSIEPERKPYAPSLSQKEEPCAASLPQKEEPCAASIPQKEKPYAAPLPEEKPSVAPLPQKEKPCAAPLNQKEKPCAAPLPQKEKPCAASLPQKEKPCAAPLPQKEKPCAAPLPQKDKKPQENLDYLLSLTKPVNRLDEESDEEAPTEVVPEKEKDVTVANVQQQASLEDWLDSILD